MVLLNFVDQWSAPNKVVLID